MYFPIHYLMLTVLKGNSCSVKCLNLQVKNAESYFSFKKFDSSSGRFHVKSKLLCIKEKSRELKLTTARESTLGSLALTTRSQWHAFIFFDF